jgi:peptide-methionine (S)-S-oxide reductase
MIRSLVRCVALGSLALPLALPLAMPLALPLAAQQKRETAVVAGGCFWGIQNVYAHMKGVISATSGYAGGSAKAADYGTVSEGRSGHAESVKIVYDPGIVSFDKLLDVFFSVAHDPTQLNRQGPDVGTQYRSVIFYSGDEQRRAAEAAIARLTQSKAYARPIVTQVVPLQGFFAAEAYHQDYAILHPTEPYIVYNDLPKVERLRAKFPELYREYPPKR